MSKTETMRQLAAANNARQAEELSQRMTELVNQKHRSVEELVEVLEPLAQAMATLTEETRKTLEEVQLSARKEAEDLKWRADQAVNRMLTVENAAVRATQNLEKAAANLAWNQYAVALMMGVLAAIVTSVFWYWLVPQPSVEMDSKAVADFLKPSVIEALKPSKGK